ncbi:hypothetical protein A4X13_0g7615 [Tilletia indica]|uniref:Uncharacterized protein n=1 Tax=Tilletia indica TaxID=43049 RepID=A0A177T9G9_9BASI|nr:hypothetical protein A4X13_0g7615 [Tilletia indica]
MAGAQPVLGTLSHLHSTDNNNNDFSKQWQQHFNPSQQQQDPFADNTPSDDDLQQQPPAMSSNTSLSSHTGVGSQGITSYLNITLTRSSTTRTLALPPSTLNTLTFHKLARILQLHTHTQHTKWAPTHQRSSSSTSVSSQLGSIIKTILLPGVQADQQLRRKSLQTEDRKYPYRIYARYDHPLRSSQSELWLPLEPFSFISEHDQSSQTPTHSLYAALLHTHLRTLIANNQFWHLDVRPWSDPIPGQHLPPPTSSRQHGRQSTDRDLPVLPFPQEDDQGLPKIGRGLSRLSLSIGAWWNGTSLDEREVQRQRQAGDRAERERADWEQDSRAARAGGSNRDGGLPPPPPPPPRRRFGSFGKANRPPPPPPPPTQSRNDTGPKRKGSFLARLFGGTGKKTKKQKPPKIIPHPIPPPPIADENTPYSDLLYRPYSSTSSKNGKRTHKKANVVPDRNPFEDDDDGVDVARMGKGEEDAVPISQVEDLLARKGNGGLPPLPPAPRAREEGRTPKESGDSFVVVDSEAVLQTEENRGKKGKKEKKVKEKKKQKGTKMDREEEGGGGEGVGMPKSGFGTGLPESVIARAKAEREASKGNKPWANRLPFRRQTTLSEVLESNERAHLQEREWLPPMPTARSADGHDGGEGEEEDGEMRNRPPPPNAGGSSKRLVERLDLLDSPTTTSSFEEREREKRKAKEAEELRRSRALPPVDWERLGEEAGSSGISWSAGGRAERVGNGREERDPFGDP